MKKPIKIIIGRKITKDKYRCIEVKDADKHNNNVQRLLTFYQERQRVDMLLNLGNLLYLGASPVEKWKGDGDKVNCRACFRDAGQSEFSNQAFETVSLDRLFKSADLIYIFIDDNWYLLNYDGTFQFLDRIVSPIIKPTILKGCEAKYLSSGYLFSIVFETQEQLIAKAKEIACPVYLFKNYRLVKVINL